jgi:hypothetical protein
MNFKIYGIIITIISIASLIECVCIIKNETSVTTNGSEVIPIGVGSAKGILEMVQLSAELISLFCGFIPTDVESKDIIPWGNKCWFFGPFSNQCKLGFECSIDWWRGTGWCR